MKSTKSIHQTQSVAKSEESDRTSSHVTSTGSGLDLNILSLVQIQESIEYYNQQALHIFWETSQQESFASQKEEDEYLLKYFQYYREQAPDLFLLAIEPPPTHNQSQQVQEAGTPGKVLGYVCAVADTRVHPELYELASHIPLFDDLYKDYPAHLHINLTGQAQGKGIGGQLIRELEARLVVSKVPGLHLVTGSNARNQSFYARCGFEHRVIRGSGPVRALFMGKKF
jgi:ribosomal protein S18 acetylase RimI-like enzyme